jgi:hypothetical protein
MSFKIMNARWTVVILAATLTACFACAKKSYIDVSYQLPPAAGTLAGHTVFIETRDLRSDTAIFNARAKADFKDFTGLFSLSVNTPGEQQRVVGAYALPKLFEAALKRRLENLGVKIAVPDQDQSIPHQFNRPEMEDRHQLRGQPGPGREADCAGNGYRQCRAFEIDRQRRRGKGAQRDILADDQSAEY